ncbi:DUF1254 domain-containing protein [Sphingomonas antarctica]|uniref:DUF1254 domain-containing protein n=1 Tax=Sphingomonas antarctica TaxID=2040274 RepID=UPI0039EB5386
MMRALVLALALAASATPALAAPRVAPAAASLLNETAEDAYIYFYPLILEDLTRRISMVAPPPLGGAINGFAHRPAFPDEKFAAIVRPNADTLYSSLWYDVTAGPLVIDVPDSGGRYYLLHLMDAWTETWGATGSRTTGTGAQRLMIVAPDWQGKVPAGVELLRSPTNQGWLLGRTQTNDPADYPAVRAFQAGMKIIAAPAAAKPPPPVAFKPPFEAVETMSAQAYFTRAAELLAANRPHDMDTPMLQRLRGLGIVPGAKFDWNALTDAQRAALTAAHDGATPRIRGAMVSTGLVRNGWRTTVAGIGTYGADYLHRAGIAWFALAANLPDDAIYPTANTDSRGKPFTSDARYTIHFAKADLPPVRAFWSLTLYNERQLFAANPIKRFAIGDRDDLTFNADGSLDLYVQRADPGAARHANWLPAPANGGFSLTMRLYWPEKRAIEGG